jgi:hypothetical protein
VTVEINGIRWNSLKLRNINIRSAGSRVAVYANKK